MLRRSVISAYPFPSMNVALSNMVLGCVLKLLPLSLGTILTAGNTLLGTFDKVFVGTSSLSASSASHKTASQDMDIVVPHNVSSDIAAPTIVPPTHQPLLPNSSFMTNIPLQLSSPVAHAFKRYRKPSSAKSGPKQKPSEKTQATKRKLNMFKPVDEDNNQSDTNSPSPQPFSDPNNAPSKKHKPNSIFSHPLASNNMVSGSQTNSFLVLATTAAADSEDERRRAQ